MGERASRIRLGLGELPSAFVVLDEDGETGVDPVEQALERGREEGRAAGRREAAEEFAARSAEQAARLAAALAELERLDDRLRLEYEQHLVELALEAASKVVRARIEAGDPIAARALREALEALPAGPGLAAHVHPDDLESIRRELGHEIDARHVELVADASVGRAGCLVESGVGTVEATLETATGTVGAAARGRPEAG